MEKLLREELIKAVPTLKDEIYPTNAPETSTKPYLVYSRINTTKVKTLKGFTGTEYLSFMFSIMATRYSGMKNLTKKIENMLMSLPQTEIGDFYIQDININNIHEVYEFDLKINRGIIDFTIYFEEA